MSNGEAEGRDRSHCGQCGTSSDVTQRGHEFAERHSECGTSSDGSTMHSHDCLMSVCHMVPCIAPSSVHSTRRWIRWNERESSTQLHGRTMMRAREQACCFLFFAFSATIPTLALRDAAWSHVELMRRIHFELHPLIEPSTTQSHSQWTTRRAEHVVHTRCTLF